MAELLRGHPDGRRFTRIGVEGDDLLVTLKAAAGRQARRFCFGHLPLDGTLPVGEVSIARRLAYIEQWYKHQDHRYLESDGYVELRGKELTFQRGDVMAVGLRERIFR